MHRIMTSIFTFCVLTIGLAEIAVAQRSSVVIGESLADTSSPQPGVLKSPFGVDFDRAGNMYICLLYTSPSPRDS